MRKHLIAVLVASCSSMAMANDLGWKVSETSGSVQIAHSGVTKIAARGLEVAAGDTVTTGPSSRAVLVRGTEYMMVAASSRLRLPTEVQATGFTQVFADVGNIVFMIKKKMTPHFEVKTPYLAAVVKGTTFSVGVTAKGASVQVLEGAVDVATPDGGAHDLLRPGSIAMVGAQDLYRMRVETNGVTRVVESPAAPTLAPVPKVLVAAASPTTPSETAAVPATAYEAPVSLASVTGGLVSGTIGGNGDSMALASVAKSTTEASSSAVKSVAAATKSIAASDAQEKASAIADTQSKATAIATQAKADADQAALLADAAAQRAADATAQANADKAKGEAESAAAKVAAQDAAAKAASAAAAASKAEADRLALAMVRAQADADSAAAAKAADAAAAAAAASGDPAAQVVANKAAKDAADAAQKAAKAASDAAQADLDKAAKDAAKAASDQAAAKAATDAAKAADDAAKASADQAKKASDAAAAASQQAAAKAAADLAKQHEKDAQDAKKTADDAAKAADAAAKAANKANDGAAKAAEKALKDISKNNNNGGGNKGG